MNGKRLFGAFAVAIALFFVFPAAVGGWQKVSAMRAAVAEREQLLAKRKEILANVSTAYAEYQKRLTSADGKKFAAFVPVHKDTAEIVSALQAMATESGAQLGKTDIAETRATEEQSNKTLVLTLELHSSYANARTFIDRLEQYVRLLNVQNIEVSPDSTSATGGLSFKIVAEAYFIQ